MSVVAKAGLGVAALGGVGIAGCYAMGVFGDTKPVLATTVVSISWTSLKEEMGSSAGEYENKIGKGYGKYFVGANTATNKAWWIDAFTKRYSPNKSNSDLSQEFSDEKVTTGYSESESTALNKVCDAVYKKSDSSEVDFSSTNENSDDNKYKLARDVLKYCSVLGQQPEKIGDAGNYSENTIGKNKKEELASITHENNGGFWEAQNKWFKSINTTYSGSMDAFFKPRKENAQQTVKDACEAAYKATAHDTPSETQPKADDVVKYCSFKKETA